jgi:hypothetical protein
VQQLVANMEASAREARAKAAASSKLKDLAPSKDVWGADVAEDVELDKVRLGMCGVTGWMSSWVLSSTLLGTPSCTLCSIIVHLGDQTLACGGAEHCQPTCRPSLKRQ